MKPHKYVSAMVVEPYYYYYHSVPYFESMYIAEHDMKYEPDQVSQNLFIIDDEDNTRVETFSCPNNVNWMIIPFIIIMILSLIYLSKK